MNFVTLPDGRAEHDPHGACLADDAGEFDKPALRGLLTDRRARRPTVVSTANP